MFYLFILASLLIVANVTSRAPPGRAAARARAARVVRGGGRAGRRVGAAHGRAAAAPGAGARRRPREPLHSRRASRAQRR